MSIWKKVVHTLRYRHSIHIASLLSFVTAVIMLVFIYQQSTVYPKKLSTDLSERVERGVVTELEALKEQSLEVARDPMLLSALSTNNIDELENLLREETTRREVERFTVVGSDGFVISRTAKGYSRGDNAFLQSSVGRLIASGVEGTTSIEAGTRNLYELFFVASTPIQSTKEKKGTLFASHLIDDEFAEHFATSYIGDNARVVFYRENSYGISGAHVSSEKNKELLNANLQNALDSIRSEKNGAVFRISGTEVLLVVDVPLEGVEGVTGGVLVFMPLIHLMWFGLIVTLIPFIVFIIFCFFLHKKSRHASNERFYYLVAFSVGISGVIVTTILFFTLIQGIPKPRLAPYPLYNSTISIQPEGGVFDLNSEQRMSIMIDSGGESINAISVKLKYDTDVVRVTMVDTTDSVCSYFLSDGGDMQGLVDIECVIPNPGFRGRGAKIADVFIQGKKKDIATFVFTDDTHVLANDGLGTDVLRQAVGAGFTFENKNEDNYASSSVTVFSSTHSNPERWYSDKKVTLHWLPRIPVAVEMTGPDGMYATKSFTTPPAHMYVDQDGSYVFSVKPVNVKNVPSSKVRVNIDTTAPYRVSLEASDKIVKIGSIVRLETSAQDSGSGLQRTSYLRIDNDLFFPIGKEVSVPFTRSGIHRITLRAYDLAGNFREATTFVEAVK